MSKQKSKASKSDDRDEDSEDEQMSEPGKEVAVPERQQQQQRAELKQMWVEKYRPDKLEQLIGHENIIGTIQKLVTAGKLPHLLLYGPPGTGKTSTIVAIAKQLYSTAYKNNVMELNTSDERGIDVIREKIKNFASTRDLFCKGFKLIILDEADHLTKDAQAALRRIIEQYTRNTRFCLVCNYVNKIIPALQSRCMRFRFSPLKKQQIEQRLTEITKLESVTATKDGLEAIVKLSNGDMRKCLHILQSTSMAYDGQITVDNVYSSTGNPLSSDILKIVNAMVNEPFATAYTNISNLKSSKGLALQDILRDVHVYALKLKLPEDVKIFLLEQMAEIEYRLSVGTSEKMQLTSLIGCFQLARETVAAKKPLQQLLQVSSME